MSVFHIAGGTPLHGTVRVSGSKNAALPMMAAAILADGPVRLRRVPQVQDVRTLAKVLAQLGVSASRSGDDALLLETVNPSAVCARYDLVRRMRASFCVLGPLLARRGRAVVSLPGGCNIGDRPVELHLRGLAALGADLELRHGYVAARARRLVGTTIDMSGPRGPTVTGTANVMTAAVLAEGETTISGAAREPEIVDLGRFLIAMGAQIVGLGTSTIRVVGVDRLEGVGYRVIPDRIEAATLLLAAAVTGGSATVTGVVPEQLTAVLEVLRAAGSQIDVGDDSITLSSPGRPRAIDVVAEPYPGVPTDVQAQLTALACLAAGRSTICDRVFPNRFMHLAELARLGARIERRATKKVSGTFCAKHPSGRSGKRFLTPFSYVVTGVPRLGGAVVSASDLRASAALVLAGLAAEGRTIVRHIHHLDRGYERLDEKLTALGARIARAGGLTHSTPTSAAAVGSAGRAGGTASSTIR